MWFVIKFISWYPSIFSQFLSQATNYICIKWGPKIWLHFIQYTMQTICNCNCEIVHRLIRQCLSAYKGVLCQQFESFCFNWNWKCDGEAWIRDLHGTHTKRPGLLQIGWIYHMISDSSFEKPMYNLTLYQHYLPHLSAVPLNWQEKFVWWHTQSQYIYTCIYILY